MKMRSLPARFLAFDLYGLRQGAPQGGNAQTVRMQWPVSETSVLRNGRPAMVGMPSVSWRNRSAEKNGSARMTITITIDTDNAAFEDGARGQEVARILTEIANQYRSTDFPRSSNKWQNVRDVNGNQCGQIRDTGGEEFK